MPTKVHDLKQDDGGVRGNATPVEGHIATILYKDGVKCIY